MAHRWHSILPVVIGVCAGFGIGLIIMGCSAKPSIDTHNAAQSLTAPPSTAGFPIPSPAAPAPAARAGAGGERTLDTTTTAAPTPAPVTTFRNAKPPRSKPGSDENLPSWVPLRGRLSVVEAPDLAENLGIVPKGTTRSAEGRVSVAEALDKSAAARPAGAAQPASATWLAANGRTRHGRSR